MQRQLLEMRELIGLISCKQSELEAKVGGHSTKIHALQMRHVATPVAPIDVDDDAELDPETFSPDGKDTLRLLDFCHQRHLLPNFRLRWQTLSRRLCFVHHRVCMFQLIGPYLQVWISMRTLMRKWANYVCRESDFEKTYAGVAFRCGDEVGFDGKLQILARD